MSTVFVPQLPSRFDAGTGLWIPVMNLDPAKAYGEIHVMFPPEANRLESRVMITAMRNILSLFSKDDYIVAIGAPTLIAAAAVIACEKTDGLLRMLQWDRHTSQYLPQELHLW